MGGMLLMAMPLMMTSCEGTLDDIFGEWSRPTQKTPETPPKPIAVTGVTLDQTTLSLVAGTTGQLTTTVSPDDAADKTVTWASADETIATVDANGKVTAVADGQTTITVTTTDGAKTADCKVIVTKDKVNVSGITLSETTLDKTTDDGAVTLVATVSPEEATDKTVVWTSSNPAVAAVSATGEVSFLDKGTATITVTATNGTPDDTSDDFSATCAVSVVKNVKGLTLDKSALMFETGNSGQLVAAVSPADASDVTVSWTSSNPSVASVDASGNVKALSKGRATITADSHGFKATCEVTVGILLPNVTADKEFIDGDIVMGQLASNVKLTIAAGATITLQDVTVNGVNDGAYGWAGITCAGNATIILKGTNIVRGFYGYYPGIFIPASYTLTIQGDGKLTATPFDGGGGTAHGAGIGGGHYPGGDCGNIIIKDGDITAIGGSYSAGIGGGAEYNCGDITISGGKVTAKGGSNAAGIGNGCSPIGDGLSRTCGVITISGGVVKANGGEYGAGIGSGYSGMSSSNYNKILISGGTVEAKGGELAAGIGTGHGKSPDSGPITITSGVIQVIATRGADPYGFGYYQSIGRGHNTGTLPAITVTIDPGANVIQN